MRNFLLVILVGTSACAARSSQPTIPVNYACGDHTVTRNGVEMRSSEAPGAISRLSWRDDKGEHFVTWPLSPTDREATEFIVPNDPLQDATQNVYDTTFGASTADWRRTNTRVCTARGGYNDVLSRYMRGESIETLTQDVGLSSRDETRALLRKALVSLQKRYWRDQ
jgi:hypothetical protein